jgi:hypothetical protein
VVTTTSARGLTRNEMPLHYLTIGLLDRIPDVAALQHFTASASDVKIAFLACDLGGA